MNFYADRNGNRVLVYYYDDGMPNISRTTLRFAVGNGDTLYATSLKLLSQASLTRSQLNYFYNGLTEIALLAPSGAENLTMLVLVEIGAVPMPRDLLDINLEREFGKITFHAKEKFRMQTRNIDSNLRTRDGAMVDCKNCDCLNDLFAKICKPTAISPATLTAVSSTDVNADTKTENTGAGGGAASGSNTDSETKTKLENATAANVTLLNSIWTDAALVSSRYIHSLFMSVDSVLINETGGATTAIVSLGSGVTITHSKADELTTDELIALAAMLTAGKVNLATLFGVYGAFSTTPSITVDGTPTSVAWSLSSGTVGVFEV